jgi:two-component system, NarL family, nitrate/nitrite response regulator NarL
MKRHIFIPARPEPVPRWLEAFPQALVRGYRVVDGTELAPVADAAVVWLHVAGDEQAVVAWVQAVRSVAPKVPIVVLSNVPDDEQGMAALSAGAVGYCNALALPAVLRQVASVVEHGGLWVGPALMTRLMRGLATRQTGQASALDALSQRERQVALAVARGANNKEIARVLQITERTVKAHLSAAFEKLGVRDRMQLSLLVNGVEESTPPPQKISA